jgi:hypothetical protein
MSASVVTAAPRSNDAAAAIGARRLPNSPTRGPLSDRAQRRSGSTRRQLDKHILQIGFAGGHVLDPDAL